MRTLRETLARLMLGQSLAHLLPGIAADALAEGLDSPALRVLAGLDLEPTTAGESEAYFHQACDELGLSIRSRREAAEVLLALWMADLREGCLPPREGARRIVCEVYYGAFDLFPDKEVCGDALGISGLVGAYWNYEDLEDREMLHEGRRIGKEEGRRILDEWVISCARNWPGGDAGKP